MTFFVYILSNKYSNYYIGQTCNLNTRLKEHGTSEGSKFARDTPELKLVYCEKYTSRLEAVRREKQLKGGTRAKKKALIQGDFERLRILSKSKF